MPTSRWFWIAVAAVVLGTIVWKHDTPATGSAGASGLCQLRVTADMLNVRAGPDPAQPVVDKLRSGMVVGAEKTVQNGFRELAPGHWAVLAFLQPQPGSVCA